MKILTKLPEDAQTSPHFKERAEGWIEVMLYGIRYYIPVTQEFKKAFKVKRKKDELIFATYKQEDELVPFLRDLISTIYLQIRDTVGSEIHGKLSRQIEHGFGKLVENYLDNQIEDALNNKLEYKDEN